MLATIPDDTFDFEDDPGSSILFQKWILYVRIIWKSGITLFSRHISSKVFLCFRYANYMLISYYANKKSSPRLPSWQPSLISFNTPIYSGPIIKPYALKLFQVPILAPGLLPTLCERNPPVTGEIPSQSPVTRSFDVFSDLRLNKRLSKQW